MAKVYLGYTKKIDARFLEAIQSIQKEVNRKTNSSIFWLKKNSAAVHLDIAKGNQLLPVTIDRFRQEGRTCYAYNKLGESVISVCMANANAPKEVFYHEVCHALSANKYYAGIRKNNTDNLVMLNEGFTNFFAKYFYNKNNKKKYNIRMFVDCEYTAIIDLFYLLTEEKSIHRLAKMYFFSNIAMLDNLFCREVFATKYNSLDFTLKSISYKDVIYIAAKNIFSKNKDKLRNKNTRKEVEEMLNVYANNQLKRAYKDVLNMLK